MSEITRIPLVDTPIVESSQRQRRRNQIRSLLVYFAVLLNSLLLAAFAYGRSNQPFFGVAWACFALLLAAWVWFPRSALAASIALVLTGDLVTVAWFPAAKNLSSYESIMYLSDGVSFSPLEISLGWALAVTAYRNFASSGRPFKSAPLVLPFLIFASFAVLGLARGLSSGGDTRAAIYEIRPLIVLPLLYVLIVNICQSRQDYRRMYWAVLTAIVLQSLLSLKYLSDLTPTVRDALESLNEHGSAIGMNLFFMMLIVALVYTQISNALRFALLLGSIPVMSVYLISQRRAAIVGLGVAFALFAVMIFWRQRRTFWKVIPVVTILAISYVGAFWQSESSIAFPAQAVKSVIAPGQASEEDQSSDIYRKLESLNLSATVRASPILGIGFGQPFNRPYKLPDISSFEFNAYFPHNSLIWVWTKMGFGGFVALLYILGRAMTEGAARARAAPNGVDALVSLNAVLFIAMYSVYLYVDVGWEPRNVVLLALALGLCTGPLNDEQTA
jgi:hypothetical protein